MTVKCLTQDQKYSLITLYKNKLFNQKQLAERFNTSERTVNRVLIEAGLATPVARIKGEAYHVMQLLKKYGLDKDSLTSLLHTLEKQKVIHAVV